MPRKRLLGWLIFGAGAAAAAIWLPPATSPSSAGGEADGQKRAQVPQAESRLAALPQREAIGKPASPIFSSQSWTSMPQQAAAPIAATVPTAPAMPYRVAGSVVQDNALQIILARGDAVLAVREGDTLDGAYRVEAIRPDRLTLLYMPLGVREELAVNSTFEDSGARPATAMAASGQVAAKVTWEGPPRVRAGDTFKVALKLTSAEAVRAAPLRLTFDADLVRPIAVRAGDFFSGGMFSYRVNPAGSIFIGASGKGGAPSNAEFLVVSFEPIRASGTAELIVSSLNLQDAEGRAIAYEQPGAFRTTIAQ